MNDKLLQGIIAAGTDIGLDELVDILWLSTRVDRGDTTMAATDTVPPDPPPATPEPEPQPSAPPPGDPLYPAHSPAPAGTVERRGRRIRVPRAQSVGDPLEIMRALRPLGPRITAHSRLSELDAEATVTASIDQRMLVPVLNPAKDRWLELTVVIDTHPSMLLWHDLVRELCRTIAQAGLFRTIDIWYLNSIQPRASSTVSRTPAGVRRDPREIVNTAGYQLILMMTDTVSDDWAHPERHRTIEQWSTHSAVAILNVLPERLWDRGSVRPSPWRLRAGTPGAANIAWAVTAHRQRRRDLLAPSRTVVPVTSAMTLGTLSKLVSGDGAWHHMPCLRIDSTAPLPDPAQPGNSQVPPYDVPTSAVALRQFRSTASPTAQELAGYLSAVPLTLPVMNLVRNVMVPHADHGHLAEVALSSLIAPWNITADTGTDSLELHFVPGVEAALLGSQHRQDVTTVQGIVRSELSRYLMRPGSSGDFPAAQATEAGTEAISATAPFAHTMTSPATNGDDQGADTGSPQQPSTQDPVPGVGVSVSGLFVGIGIDNYQDLAPLSFPTAQVRALAAQLEPMYRSELLFDPTEPDVRSLLPSRFEFRVSAEEERPSSLVLFWSGHGSYVHGSLVLHTSEHRGQITAADLARGCAETGASQILIILDTLSASAEAHNIMTIVRNTLAEYLPAHESVWVGVLTSSSSEGDATHGGVLITALLRLLRYGPRSSDNLMIWSAHQETVTGEDLIRALLDEWNDDRQGPDFLRYGRSRAMFRNPLFSPAAPVSPRPGDPTGGSPPAAVKATVLLMYFVADESASMAHLLEDLNDGLRRVLDTLQAESMAAAKIRLGVIGFSNTAVTHLEPTDARNIESIPVFAPRRGRSFRAAFDALSRQIPRDVARLQADGNLVNRPVVFFLTDGMPDPDDGWEGAYQQLTELHAAPNILAYGIGEEVSEAVIKRIATRPAYAFIPMEGVDLGSVISRYVVALTQSVVTSRGATDTDFRAQPSLKIRPIEDADLETRGMVGPIDVSQLGAISRLGEGGEGEVYQTTLTLKWSGGANVVYKRFKPHLREYLDIEALKAMPVYLESLPEPQGTELLSRAAWPCRLVENSGTVDGFLMPAVPERFSLNLKITSGISRRMSDFQHLLNEPAVLTRRGISLTDTDRYELLGAVTRAFVYFHAHHITVGDVSPKNILFSLPPTPEVYFIDCDAMRLSRRTVLPQLETPDWDIRSVSGEELGTVYTDRYKLGLLALRLLVGDQQTRDPRWLPAHVPQNIRNLIERALDPTPSSRPHADSWIDPLGAAATGG